MRIRFLTPVAVASILSGSALVLAVAMPVPNNGATDPPFLILDGHAGAVYTIAFNRTGMLIASGGEDCTVRVADTKTGKTTAVLAHHRRAVNHVAFLSDNQLLSNDKYNVYVTDIETLHLVGQITPPGTVRFSRIAISPDNKLFASISFSDGIIALWDIKQSKLKSSFGENAEWSQSLAFSPDGKLVAWGGQNGSICIWDVQLQKKTTTLPGHVESVTSLVFSKDGKTLISASTDHSVAIWNLERKHLVKRFVAHTDWVLSVMVSNDDSQLLTRGGEIVTTWKLASGERIANFRADSKLVLCMAIDSKSTMLAAGGMDKQIRIWLLK
jgi:WD40 repeat protein